MNEITLNKLRWGYGSSVKRWLLQKLLVLMVLFGTVSLNAQIHIGANGTTTTSYFPLYGLYNYNYSQQIVLASEYAAADGVGGPITQIKWKITTNGTGSTNWNNWSVFIGHTTKTSFTGTTDYVPHANLGAAVYSGIVTFDGNNTWVTINLTTPFVYNGTDNILVAVIEDAPGWGSTPSFAAYNNSATHAFPTTNRGVYYYQDPQIIDTSAPDGSVYKGVSNTIAQIQFTGVMSPCASPQNVVITNTHNSATATWNANANADLGVSYELRTSGGPNSGATGLVDSGTLAAGVNTVSLSNLLPSTNYTLYLKTNCSTYTSSWGAGNSFTTFSLVPSPWYEGFATATAPVGFVVNGFSLTNSAISNPGSTGYFYRVEQWVPGDIDAVTVVNVGPILTGDKFSFDYNVSDYYTPGDFVDVGAVNFRVEFFVNFSNTPVLISEFTNSGDNQWGTFEYPLTSYVGQVVKAKVTAVYTSTDYDFDYYVGLDNFYIGSCALPLTTNIAKTNNSATLSWDGYTGNTYTIEYGPTGFAPGTGTIVTGVTNNHLISGLLPTTTYQVYVINNCGNSSSPKVGPFAFTTETVVPSPWFEGFATSTMPVGFNVTGLTLTNDLASNPGSNGYFYRQNLDSAGEIAVLSTVNVGPILTGDVFSFDYSLREWNGGPGTPAGEASFNIELSTNFGNSYISIGDFLNEENSDWVRFEYPLGAYVGQVVKIRVKVERLSGDYYIGLDNFYIGSCAMPNVPQVANTTMNSALLEWIASPTDVFEIEYGPVGFVQGSGTVLIATGSSINISGLTESTQYEYYIRRKCSDTNFSPRMGKFKFITSCAVFTTSFVENFDSTATGSSTNSTVPICWTFYDGGAGYGFVNTGSVAPATPSKHFYIYNNSDMTNPYILISPETDNLGNGAYQVRFKARTGSNGAKLKFGRMSNKLDASTFVEITEITLPTTYSATDFVVYLPVTTDDYFAFKFAPSATYQSLYIDNVNYEPIPACAPPVGLNAQANFANMTANLTWQGPPNVTNNNFEIEWGETGFVQGSADGTIVTSTTLNTTISNLVMGESYSFYVRRMCGAENTAWVGPYTFVMDYCIPNSNNVEGVGMTGLVVDGTDFEITMDDSNLYNTQYLNTNELSLTAGVNIPIEATYSTASSGGWLYDYYTTIWIDLNNDGILSNSEIVFTAIPIESSIDGVTHELPAGSSFIIPDGGNNITGVYRMRIIGRESSYAVDSCVTGSTSWFFTVDMNVNIVFPCIQPTNINFLDVGYEYVVLDWEGQGNNNFELEYGVTGFVPGTGTTLLNVTKPYTLENLTPGTTYDFYIRKKCGDLYSDWSAVASTYVFCDTPEPTGASSQTLVSDQLLSDLVIEGQNLKFYTDPSLTQEVPASTVLQVSGTYFVTQTINCESDSFLIVDVTVLPRIAMPIVAAGQSYCDGGVIADIPVTSISGATVIWYASATSTTPLAANTPLVTGVYYVVQTDGITTSHRLSVPVVINTTPPNLVSQTISLCGSYTFGNLAINNLQGTTVKWYVSTTATAPIANNVPVVTGTYYVTQSFGICESQRVPYQVTQNESLNKPIAGVQNFCGSGTVADLVAQGVPGAQLLWYASATSVNALNPSATLSSGTYYVAQTMNGCSSERRAVAVRVISIAAPQLTPFTVCGGGTISDLYIPVSTETSYRWYLTPSSDFELEQTTPLVQGTYFVERVQYGCVSARTAVQVNIGEVPNPPTGVATQSFVEGSTIANLVLNQSNVVWYASFNDSQNGVNPLPSYTPLVNGTTYFAVIIGTNGCPSYPLAVTVDVYLSNDEFDKEGLKYYPNPVNDVLNIDYVESIRFVEVFDLLGKRVKTLNTNDQNVQIDLSDLASGTYMIQLKTDSKTQFIKVIKK
ncbi:T9SS C-terminal target domain-containing protein [Paenimyroides tangerinum]|uniref:T9SS C-terminal target domain-containing protein n=1 Tax=Paenimyroides tangerinum TaxID=2488728 RepID=A0A3P3WB78_9FLAO|nr:T9SS type A sorting domain-containing protein [Paenimyroides tangerinum]RRJ92441.1 T9SS C-terminal target domain-containing protein [Paenimyroides tangerinum]